LVVTTPRGLYSGEFIVRKVDENGEDQVVFVYTVEGSAFGELSLMYGKPRAASVVAKTQGKLWCIGRAAFRAVIMLGKQDGDGLLEVYRTIPVFKDLSRPTLQRLCTAAVERSYEKGEVVHNEETAPASQWVFCIVTTGVLRLIAKGEGKKRQLRAELSYFSTFEIGAKFSEARADSKMKLSCLSAEVCLSVLGAAGLAQLKETVEKAKSKGKRLEIPKSLFDVPENFQLSKQADVARFTLEHPTTLLGKFGYVAQYKDSTTGKLCSVKVVAKAKSAQLRMDGRMLQERNFLAAMFADPPPGLGAAGETWLPVPLAVMQDEKKAYVSVRPCIGFCGRAVVQRHTARCYSVPSTWKASLMYMYIYHLLPLSADDLQGPVRLRPVGSPLRRRLRAGREAAAAGQRVRGAALHPRVRAHAPLPQRQLHLRHHQRRAQGTLLPSLGPDLSVWSMTLLMPST
jgi:CRP-like cAMP-binding protein